MTTENFKQLQNELKSIIQKLNTFNKVNLNKAESFTEIERIIKSLPSSETSGRAIGEWQKKARIEVDKAKQARKNKFRGILAGFIKGQQAKRVPTREFGQSWRVGPLAVQLRSEFAQIQIAYNNEVVIKWSSLSQTDDILKIYEAALKKLEETTLPLNKQVEVFWSAYDYLRWQQTRNNVSHPELVPLKNFYLETKVALTRFNLHKKVTLQKEYPLWAFLYNLDIYHSKIAETPPKNRLGLQTGSQDQSRKMGIVTNGLNPLQDYRTYCYIHAG